MDWTGIGRVKEEGGPGNGYWAVELKGRVLLSKEMTCKVREWLEDEKKREIIAELLLMLVRCAYCPFENM